MDEEKKSTDTSVQDAPANDAPADKSAGVMTGAPEKNTPDNGGTQYIEAPPEPVYYDPAEQYRKQGGYYVPNEAKPGGAYTNEPPKSAPVPPPVPAPQPAGRAMPKGALAKMIVSMIFGACGCMSGYMAVFMSAYVQLFARIINEIDSEYFFAADFIGVVVYTSFLVCFIIMLALAITGLVLGCRAERQCPKGVRCHGFAKASRIVSVCGVVLSSLAVLTAFIGVFNFIINNYSMP